MLCTTCYKNLRNNNAKEQTAFTGYEMKPIASRRNGNNILGASTDSCEQTIFFLF